MPLTYDINVKYLLRNLHKVPRIPLPRNRRFRRSLIKYTQLWTKNARRQHNHSYHPFRPSRLGGLNIECRFCQQRPGTLECQLCLTEPICALCASEYDDDGCLQCLFQMTMIYLTEQLHSIEDVTPLSEASVVPLVRSEAVQERVQEIMAHLATAEEEPQAPVASSFGVGLRVRLIEEDRLPVVAGVPRQEDGPMSLTDTLTAGLSLGATVFFFGTVIFMMISMAMEEDYY